MTALVPDEVWIELDPRFASPSRRARLRAAVAGILAVLLAVGLGVMHIEGLLAPQLSPWSAPSQFSFDVANHSFDEALTLTVSGWSDVDVRSVRVIGTGYRLLSVRGVPGIVPNGEHPVVVRLRLEVTDCLHPPRIEPVLRFGVHQWWGLTHTDVQTPPTYATDTEQGAEAFMDGPARVACGLPPA